MCVCVCVCECVSVHMCVCGVCVCVCVSRQHMRNCTLSGNQLTQDILSYNLPLIGCSENSSTEEISVATGLLL